MYAIRSYYGFLPWSSGSQQAGRRISLSGFFSIAVDAMGGSTDVAHSPASPDARITSYNVCYTKLLRVSTNPCGEIPLCPYDSCRLLAINLYSYVENPFTPQAKFNFDLFKEHIHYAQRIMDDIIDLELEKIDAIIEKVEADPEPEEIKYTELRLWENIKRSYNFV